ncbi:hypothetical protein BpHYR1_006601 [Brachionus plicatilis]|uniref:Uncharacterized protein n=1 Tax=Brachionus plicatilis TaxID=10195 RepID=A0A3M7QPP5_BRAPC|nr:hypothetical protein BpHYR1_006601 [Brachionus plicatilis]
MAGCEYKAVAFGIYKIKLKKDKSIQNIFVVERRSGQRRARLPSQIRPNLLHLALHRQVRLHPIRLLTLIKHSKLKDTLSSCLCVYLSAKNHSLFVNTDECLLNQLKHVEKRLFGQFQLLGAVPRGPMAAFGHSAEPGYAQDEHVSAYVKCKRAAKN